MSTRTRNRKRKRPSRKPDRKAGNAQSPPWLWWQRPRLLVRIGVGLGLLLILVVFAANRWVISDSRDRLYFSSAQLPSDRVGLVLGTSRWSRTGGINPFFKHRMEAAAELYRLGKVHHLLVSGDNERNSYNEPAEMRRYLRQLGVPDEAITLDFAGFRTLDSVVRAKKVFGQDQITIISQENHNYRALFIAKHYGIDAVAFAAKEVSPRRSVRTHVREWLARFKAVLDIYLLDIQPRYLGQPVALPVPTLPPPTSGETLDP